MTVEEFVNKSAKPIFVYRMAKGNLSSPGSKTRMKKAEKEILDLAEILTNYHVEDNDD